MFLFFLIDDILLNKPGTDVLRWHPNAATVLATLAPERIIVYGVATNLCTRAAIAGLARLRPEAKLVIVTDAIRGINDDTSRALVTEWRASGHMLLKTAELIAWHSRGASSIPGQTRYEMQVSTSVLRARPSGCGRPRRGLASGP